MEAELMSHHERVFSFDLYPHVAKKIFLLLDSVTLIRCKLVCKSWYLGIRNHVERCKTTRAEMLRRYSIID